MAPSIVVHFADVPDPRDDRGLRHRLEEMLTIAICAVVCGANDWSEVALFGESKSKWFKTFLRLPHGIPSHDTFARVFAALEPEALERCFVAWTQALADAGDGELIAIDGKTLCRSFDRASDKAAIHMISAWATENELVFGQVATEAKSNEITAMPKLLELLDLHGTTVSIDAEGCQKNIARQIIEQGGDYVLALKANHPTMHAEVSTFLNEAIARDFHDVAGDTCEHVDGDHGRVETRRTWVTSEVSWFADRQQWAGLQSFVAVECERTVDGQTSCERRYFISSLPGTDAEAMARAVRGHWGIENKLHWSLDVTFAEDACRTRIGHAAENFSRLRRIALNLLKREQSRRTSLKKKRLLAGWDHDYLLRLLTA